MMTDAQLQARDANRDIGAELLSAVRELQTGKAARTTKFESLADGSVRRTVTLANGTVQTKRYWWGRSGNFWLHALRLACRSPSLLVLRVCRFAPCRNGSRAARCPAVPRKVC
jgi:hypothetical protein